MIDMFKMKSFKKNIKNEFYYGNRILRDWIKEEDPNYFKEIEIQIIKFSCKQVATYMLNKMNKAKFRYIKKKWYCCTEKGSWEQSERLLYLEINSLAEYYHVYIYLVKPISDFK